MCSSAVGTMAAPSFEPVRDLLRAGARSVRSSRLAGAAEHGQLPGELVPIPHDTGDVPGQLVPLPGGLGHLLSKLVPLPDDAGEPPFQLDDAADGGQRHALAHQDNDLLNPADVMAAVAALTARRTLRGDDLLVIDAAQQRLLYVKH